MHQTRTRLKSSPQTTHHQTTHHQTHQDQTHQDQTHQAEVDRGHWAAGVSILVLAFLLWTMLSVGPVGSTSIVRAQDATPVATEEPAEEPVDEPAEASALPQAPLQGTIVANRTDVVITFFLEGETFTVQPQRSVAVELPRSTSVLNLYNCEAGVGADSADCFWDPYLMRQDGFYEVINGAHGGKPVSLLIQDAATPPGDQVWLHNRTGSEEAIYYSGAVYTLGAGTTTEVVLVDDDSTVFRRDCLEMDGQSVCEWLPQEVSGGVYYALARTVSPGDTADRRRLATGLVPVLAEDVEVLVTQQTQQSVQPQVACALNVPTLNVRAGPGVDYLILSKLRQSELGDDLVAIRGRTADSVWLAVDESVTPGGWISANARYVTCAGEIPGLPVAEVADGRLAPTPVPQAAQPAAQPANQPEPEAAATPEAAPDQPQAPGGPPPGQVRLVVINSFGQPLRFTFLDTEYDLAAGQQVIIDTSPGLISFSASSAWRNNSGNADFQMLADETRVLYVRWELINDSWVLKYD